MIFRNIHKYLIAQEKSEVGILGTLSAFSSKIRDFFDEKINKNLEMVETFFSENVCTRNIFSKKSRSALENAFSHSKKNHEKRSDDL